LERERTQDTEEAREQRNGSASGKGPGPHRRRRTAEGNAYRYFVPQEPTLSRKEEITRNLRQGPWPGGFRRPGSSGTQGGRPPPWRFSAHLTSPLDPNRLGRTPGWTHMSAAASAPEEECPGCQALTTPARAPPGQQYATIQQGADSKGGSRRGESATPGRPEVNSGRKFITRALQTWPPQGRTGRAGVSPQPPRQTRSPGRADRSRNFRRNRSVGSGSRAWPDSARRRPNLRCRRSPPPGMTTPAGG